MFAIAAAACSLLTSAEIRKVQGETVEEAKAAPVQEAHDLRVEQCFFRLPTFAKSISLEVTRGKGVPAYWKRAFHEEHDDGEAEEKEKPEQVRRLGDDAVWTGGVRLGGLYVLRRDVMLRLSVGGPETKDAKLKKLRVLARYALRRL